VEHYPKHRRKTLGRGALAHQRTRYGWDSRCSCGWESKSNENKRHADRLHRAHAEAAIGAELWSSYAALERRACSFQQWVSLKLSCSTVKAGRIVQRLMDANGGRLPQ
jgi:hypothetical protein